VDGIVPAVAGAIGVIFHAPDGGSEPFEPQQLLINHLLQKKMLLIMDNYEHLLSPPSVPPTGGEEERESAPAFRARRRTEGRGEELVSEILRTAPGIKIIATSRARLNVSGEHRLKIGGMEYPALEAPVALAASAPPSSTELDAAAQYGACAVCSRFAGWWTVSPWQSGWQRPGWRCSHPSKLRPR
jgi:hypothetical protein